MPTYPYLCKDCGHSFEVFQSFTDDALTTCPECSGNLRKVYTSVGVVFKGSGFYKTDSRTETGGSTSAKPAEKKAQTSTEQKSAASDKSKDAPSGTASSTDTKATAPAS